MTARTASADHRAQCLPIIGEEPHRKAGPAGRDVELLGGRGTPRKGALGDEDTIDRLALARMAGRHISKVPGAESAVDNPDLIRDDITVADEARDRENAAIVQAMPILADTIAGDAQALADTDRDPLRPEGLKPFALGCKVKLEPGAIGTADRKV